MLPPSYTTLPDRFWSRVAEPDENGCWLWSNGELSRYGQFRWESQPFSTHRLAAADAKGAIPEGLWVLHHCDRPPCVNPDHLYFGTRQDNTDDRTLRGRNINPIGEKHGQSKLTALQVTELRTTYKSGDVTQKELAAKYGISRTQMHTIIHRKQWVHIPEEASNEE